MTVTIRQARDSDAQQIYDFVHELATYEREPQAVVTSPAVIAEQLADEDPPFRCLIAERDGTAVGFALYFRSYSTWTGRPGIYLEDLYVPPQLRGQGIGTALLRELARLAVDAGYTRLELSVLDWNTPASDVYRKLGATAKDDWTTYRFDGAALTALAKG